MANSKRAATYHPNSGPPRLWHIRWYHHKRVHVTHDMPRESAMALARTMRECGIPTVIVPAVESRRPL